MQDRLYFIPFKKLRRWAFHDHNIYKWPERKQGKYQQLNDAWGRCVPIDVIVSDLQLGAPFNPVAFLATQNRDEYLILSRKADSAPSSTSSGHALPNPSNCPGRRCGRNPLAGRNSVMNGMTEARARRERLYHPEGGHTSTDLDILSVPAERALAIARIEAEAERRTADALAAEAAWRRYVHYIHIVGRSFDKPDRWPKITKIQKAVCGHYGVSRADLLSHRRNARIVRARQVAMYLARILTTRTFPELGRRFGGKDHTTVLHAVNKIAVLLPADAQLAADVAAIRQTLEGA